MLPRTIRCGGVSFDLEGLLWVKKLVLTVATAVALVLGVGVADASTSPGLSDKRSALLKKHNDARASKCGSGSLKMSSGANEAALYHAKDMADENYFSHDSQNPYEAWYKRIDRFVLYQVGGENIAKGYDTVSGVFDAWMDSDGHRRNIMDCSFKWVGFGYAEQSGRKYWVADFVYGSGSGF